MRRGASAGPIFCGNAPPGRYQYYQKALCFMYLVRKWVPIWIAISLCYLAAAWVSFTALGPVQARLLPDITLPIALIYLPHGVRVLAAWFYGWASVPLLLPVIAATFYLLHGVSGFTLTNTLGIGLSASAAAVAFALLRLIGLRASAGDVRPGSARIVLLASLLGALFNAAVPGALFGYAGGAVIIFVLGDTLGAIVLLGVLMFFFRWLRGIGH